MNKNFLSLIGMNEFLTMCFLVFIGMLCSELTHLFGISRGPAVTSLVLAALIIFSGVMLGFVKQEIKKEEKRI